MTFTANSLLPHSNYETYIANLLSARFLRYATEPPTASEPRRQAPQFCSQTGVNTSKYFSRA